MSGISKSAFKILDLTIPFNLIEIYQIIWKTTANKDGFSIFYLVVPEVFNNFDESECDLE